MKLTSISTIVLALGSPSALLASTACSDRTDLWTIGKKTKNWCRWVRIKGSDQSQITHRCNVKNLHKDCPFTCGTCSPPVPSLAPTVIATATTTVIPPPSCCSCEVVAQSIEGAKIELREAFTQDVESLRAEIRELDEKSNEILTILKATVAPAPTKSPTAPTPMPTIPGPLQNIGAGDFHTCAIDDTLDVWCWGWNGNGQLGTSNAADSLTPTNVYFKYDVRQIEVGGEHSCAVDDLSNLFCWGRNDSGQLGLGDGDKVTRRAPTEISLGSSVSLVRLGSAHSCALDVFRNLFCWGRNVYGQLGFGDTLFRYVPTKVDFDNSISQLGLGGHHSCAVDDIDNLFCWGQNLVGQLGVGDDTNRHTPTQVLMDSAVIMLALGLSHTCAVDSLSKILCWGSNGEGQLGVGDTIHRSTPTEVMSSMIGASQIAAGRGHSCAIDSNGHLWCWGWNKYGQLGLGDETIRLTPTEISSIDSVFHIALGRYQSCAMNKYDELWCWGENGSGQLGVGNKYQDCNTPTLVDSF